MKALKLFLMTIGVVGMTIVFQSCLDDDDDTSWRYPNALVTVKPTDGNSFFLQLDEKTTLLPTNMTTSPYGNREVRALVNYDEVDKPSQGYTKAIHINWIDSILTKQTVPNLGAENDAKYGTDPIEIVNDWVTIAEDGYLTLRFRTLFGDASKTHYVNLLVNTNPSNPYELEFRHNASGDTYGREADGLVAFNINNLPDTEGKTVKLKLKWKSFSGNKSTEFDFTTRKATPKSSAITAQRSVSNIK